MEGRDHIGRVGDFGVDPVSQSPGEGQCTDRAGRKGQLIDRVLDGVAMVGDGRGRSDAAQQPTDDRSHDKPGTERSGSEKEHDDTANSNNAVEENGNRQCECRHQADAGEDRAASSSKLIERKANQKRSSDVGGYARVDHHVEPPT